MVGFHYNETPHVRQAGKILLPGEGDPPLLSRFPEKVRIGVPPLIQGVVTKDPKPLRQFSQIAIGGESDIHVSLRGGSGAA